MYFSEILVRLLRGLKRCRTLCVRLRRKNISVEFQKGGLHVTCYNFEQQFTMRCECES